MSVKNDQDKPRVDLVIGGFPRALLAISEVGTMGAKKYTDNGWQQVPNGFIRYSDAGQRHYLMGKIDNLDEESGLLHLAHEAWNALAKLELFLIEEANPLSRPPED